MNSSSVGNVTVVYGMYAPASYYDIIAIISPGFYKISYLSKPAFFNLSIHSAGNPLSPIGSFGSTYICILCYKFIGFPILKG
jgi:hypothetical protein